MQIKIQTQIFKKNIHKLSNVLSTNSIIPILENYFFEIKKEEKKIKMTCSDLQTYICVEFDFLEIVGDFFDKICIPAKLLNEITKYLNDEILIMNFNSKNFELKIESNNGLYKIMCESPNDFPTVDWNKQILNQTIICQKKFKNIIANSIVTSSKDEAKPNLNGIFFKFSKDQIELVSTDEHRLSIYEIKKNQNIDKEIEFIISKRSINNILSVLENEEKTLSVFIEEKHLKISIDNLLIYIKIIKEKFPNYKMIIPKNNDKTILIRKNELLFSLKRLSIFANKSTKFVLFTLSENNLKIISKDFDFNNEGIENLNCMYQDFPIEIGFNIFSLIDLVSTINDSQIILKFSEFKNLVLLCPENQNIDEKQFLYIMPMACA
jgi:DNA polymerase-3 subunit beta